MAEQHGLTAAGLNEALDKAVSQQAVTRRRARKEAKRPKVGMTAEQAKRIAADLDGYDSRIQGGRLVGG